MTHEFRCGDGTVELGDDGSVNAVRHPRHPELNALLDEQSAPWFGPDWRWGTGFVISDLGSGRFAAPHTMSITSEVAGTYEPAPGLQVEVTRTFGDLWRERYVLRNLADRPARIGSFAINTPLADAYGPARTVLSTNLHAHVWTGGAESWLVGVRMDGTPPALGLDLVEGELWAYSISGRHQFTSSNVRGVISLHATDEARAPHAFGGQPAVVLEPGEELRVGWEIGWYEDVPAAVAGHRATIAVPSLAAPVGSAIAVGETSVVAHEHGVSHVDVPHPDGRRSRVAVLHHTPIDELVRRRVAAVIAKHRAVERQGTRAAAFVPYDVERDLRLTHDLGWTDWSDARERVGMPLLLLAARQRGWVDDVAVVDESLLAYKEFCLQHLITSEHRIRNSSTADGHARLYNSPWFALLFAELFATYGSRDDLLTAVAILDRYYTDGGERFLAITIAEAATRVANLCDGAALPTEASRVRQALLEHGRTLAALGTDLPEHEVSYEQSMTAPLLSILSGAWRISPDPELVEAMRTVTDWLLAFAGRQPHVRLRNVPIRHWDGFWFGRLRLWGDTFPHYWSILSPRALLDLPAEVEVARADEIVRDVTAANLVDFTPDGNASCAFLFPSCVDDQPGYRADPLANDQDLGLALTLLPGTSGHAPAETLSRTGR